MNEPPPPMTEPKTREPQNKEAPAKADFFDDVFGGGACGASIVGEA
jgi:hypothetical protein